MIRAVIFDMDGLIIETESLQSKAYEQIIREYGKEPIFEDNGLVHKVGLRGDDAWKTVLNKHDLTGDIEQLRSRKRELYLEILKKNLIPMPGLRSLLSILSEKKIPMSLATGTIRQIATYVLTELDILDYFSVLVTGDEVKKGKPDPETFMLASKRLHVIPSECLVFEDAQPGVTAAKLLGMCVIAVPTSYTKKDNFSQADKVVKSLESVNWEVIAAL
ncbi:MAG: HAD family phosphatase [Patescibacteria group bacterium]|nr:HAD family phosphatase [Patescibacteria group bacterium]MDE2591087.1 HAD family phosphatase [Patescibacteria group bacterium]